MHVVCVCGRGGGGSSCTLYPYLCLAASSGISLIISRTCHLVVEGYYGFTFVHVSVCLSVFWFQNSNFTKKWIFSRVGYRVWELNCGIPWYEGV